MISWLDMIDDAHTLANMMAQYFLQKPNCVHSELEVKSMLSLIFICKWSIGLLYL